MPVNFLNFSIEVRPLKDGLMSYILLVFFVGSFYASLEYTNNFSGERMNPSLQESVVSGPYHFENARTRNSSGIMFKINDSDPGFYISQYEFNKDVIINDLRNNSTSTAYLWIFVKNKKAPVWRVVVDGREVLSYNKAIFNYRSDIKTGFFALKISAFSLLFLLFRIFKIKLT